MRISRLSLFVLPLFVLPLVGCDKKKEETPATADAAPIASTQASAVVVPSASAARRGRDRQRGFGVAGLLLQAADDAVLKPEQEEKIEKLADGMKDGAHGGEQKAMHEELAAGVKAGKIDKAKLEPHYASFEKSTQARLDKEADALNGLYAALDPAQRKAIATDARARETKREEKMGRRDRPDSGASDDRKRHVEQMTKDLGLDADQQKKVDAIVAKEPAKPDTWREDLKKRNEEVFAAFEKDGFDAKKLDAFKFDKKGRESMENEAQLVSQLLTVLKPEQREKLAKQIESGPPKGAGGRPGINRGLGANPHAMPEEK